MTSNVLKIKVLKSLRKIKDLKHYNFLKYLVYFFLIYLSTECLNGNNGDFIKHFGNNPTFIEKITLILEDISYFFWFPKILFGILIYLSVFLLLYGITKKSRFSCIVISSVSFIFAIINYIVTQVRGTAITPSDLFAAQTALNVAEGISIEINMFFVIGILLFIFANIKLFKDSVFEEFLVEKEDKKVNKITSYLKCSVIGLIGVIVFWLANPYLNKVQIWDVNYAYKQAGAALTLMRLTWNLDVEEPQNYDENNIEKMLNSYVDNVDKYSGNKPNILIVMNESFADVLNVYNIESSGDNLPFFHSLISGDNVVTGNMHSSFIGTKTANVEFEFLTQNTYTALPTNSYPYQQYINEPIEQSLVNYMNRLEYDTYGIHSWYSNGYNRNKIYELMQFDNVLFKEDMLNLEYLPNEYSTDSSTYEYWFNIMKNKEKDRKNFTFLLTVQNHLPYNNDDGELTNYVEDDEELNVYLNYINESDKALEKLINFIDGYEEDTIVLFFGDHQPILDLKEKYGANEIYSDDEVSYIVPFFIYANYDINEKRGIETSANFLQNILFDTANLPRDEYTQYVDSIRKDIPVITTQYYIDKNRQKFEFNNEESPYINLIKQYWDVVYYQMFDISKTT